MGKKISAFLKQVSAIDDDAAFVQLSYELLNSPAWRCMSLPCRKLLEFLMLEHMTHGGAQNSELFATYDQLEKFGIARSHINKTLREAEILGLVVIDRRGRQARNRNYITYYKLTFLPYRFMNEKGVKMYSSPDNEWRAIKDADAEAIKGRKPKRVNINS